MSEFEKETKNFFIYDVRGTDNPDESYLFAKQKRTGYYLILKRERNEAKIIWRLHRILYKQKHFSWDDWEKEFGVTQDYPDSYDSDYGGL